MVILFLFDPNNPVYSYNSQAEKERSRADADASPSTNALTPTGPLRGRLTPIRLFPEPSCQQPFPLILSTPTRHDADDLVHSSPSRPTQQESSGGDFPSLNPDPAGIYQARSTWN